MAVETHTPRQSPSTPTHYDPTNNGTWDGQLAHGNLLPPHSDPTIDLPARKVGGPADRLQWTFLVAPFITANELRVLLVGTQRSKPDGTFFPSQGSIAQDTGLSRPRVNEAVQGLVSKGVWKIVWNGKNFGRSSTYQLTGALTDWNLPSTLSPKPDTPDQSLTGGGVTETGHPVSPKPDTRCHRNRTPPVTETGHITLNSTLKENTLLSNPLEREKDFQSFEFPEEVLAPGLKWDVLDEAGSWEKRIDWSALPEKYSADLVAFALGNFDHQWRHARAAHSHYLQNWPQFLNDLEAWSDGPATAPEKKTYAAPATAYQACGDCEEETPLPRLSQFKDGGPGLCPGCWMKWADAVNLDRTKAATLRKAKVPVLSASGDGFSPSAWTMARPSAGGAMPDFTLSDDDIGPPDGSAPGLL